MGFYGNITYNTYGLQRGSVKPEHLDREYWQYKTSNENGIMETIEDLEKFLELNGTLQDDLLKTQYRFWINIKPYPRGEYLGYVVEKQQSKSYIFIITYVSGNEIYIGQQYYIIISETGKFILPEFSNDLSDQEKLDLVRVGPMIDTDLIIDAAVTNDKLATDSVSTIKIQKDAIVTDKILKGNVTPEKLDRDYWERTFWSSITSYTDLYLKCTPIPSNSTMEAEANKGTLYIIKSLKLYLPQKYTDSQSSSYLNIEDNELYDFGQCFVQNVNNVITITSGTWGQIWTIEKISGNTSLDECRLENGQYYKPVLKQISTPQIKDRSISTIKMVTQSVIGGTDANSIIKDHTITGYNIANHTIKGDATEESNIAEKTITGFNIDDYTLTPEKLDREYLEKQVLWDEIVYSWPQLYEKMNEITAKNGTLYFIQDIDRESCLPQKYKDLDPNANIFKFERCMAWRVSNTTIMLQSFRYGIDWSITHVRTVDTADLDKVEITSEQVKFLVNDTVQVYSVRLKEIAFPMIAEHTIKGDADVYSNIAKKTIAGDNIANQTITSEHIAPNTITQNNLKDTYARCYYGEGVPGTTAENFVYNADASIGDLYIDVTTGYIYCLKGYNFSAQKYEWIPTQTEFWLQGEKSTTRPVSPTVGTVWMDSDSGKLYVYKRIADTEDMRWEELRSYQIENKDIKDKTITASKLAPGTIQQFLLNNTLLTIPCENPEIGLTEEDVENFILANFSDIDYPFFVINYGNDGGCLLGYKINRNEGGVKYNSLDCLDLQNKTLCRLSINHASNRQHPIDRVTLETMGVINMNIKPSQPTIGAMFYNDIHKCLEVYDGNQWNYIFGYNQAEAAEVSEE